MQRDDFVVRRYPGLDSVGLSGATCPLRVAIVTEEIIGPVRNGGIASTYHHLAKGLAAHGHEVHVLFLKGPLVQDETPEHWVEKYAELGVHLHYLQTPDVPVWCAAPTWQRRYTSAYEWLRDQEPFDVVHTSEWRGGLVYALMAKRLGLAFRDTLFLVKTSSPYIWNRHYQMEPITETQLVAAAHAEQKCVELADVVIGGSAHLISFMDRIGYRMPEPNVYVQPNIVDFSNLTLTDRRPGPRQHGDVVRTRDLVFFGRLEQRKGIELFCSAIDLLHQRGEIPGSVTFLGKWGARLPAQGGMRPQDYVAEKALTWTCPVTVVTDLDQSDALSLLCERNAIAVMPSLIENSSMAVYETLAQRIPFIATAVGGTSELVAEEDHETCLVQPTAQALADRLQQALRHGQAIARPRFSNDDNLKVWYGFHAHLGELIARHGHRHAFEQLTQATGRPRSKVETVSFVALVHRGDSLDDLAKAIHSETPDEIVLGFNDAVAGTEIENARASLEESCANVRVLSCMGETAGEALNTLVARQRSDVIVVANGVGAVPRFGLFEAALRGLGNRPSCLFTTFFTTGDAIVGMPLGGDVASQLLTSRAYGPELFAIRRDTFDDIGSFEPYDTRHGLIHEYVTRAAESGHDLLVLPEQLLRWDSAVEDTRAFHADPVCAYLNAKPLIDESDLAHRKVLLAALHQARNGRSGVDEELLAGGNESDSNWLTPATWDPEDVGSTRSRRLIIGLDANRDEIWLYARGPGERRLLVRGEPASCELVVDRGPEGTDDRVTLATFRVPDTWQAGTSYPLLWGLYDGEEKLRNTFLRINKIGEKTYALSGRTPVLSSRALTELVDRQPATGPGSPDDLVTTPEDPTDEYVAKAVAAALAFVKQRSDADPVRIVETSRALLANPPTTLPPITPRSGLKPPEGKEGWCIGDWFMGWAWDREDRERILHVAAMRGNRPLLIVRADAVDRSLEDVPGRGAHAFQMPVLPEFFEGDRLRLAIWEGGSRLYRGALYVDRDGGEPMIRRFREQPVATRPDAAHAGTRRRKEPWWRRT
jgi:glycosyltransferase involved in cell wall biosynthesis